MATYNFTESGNYIYVEDLDNPDNNYNGAKCDVRAYILSSLDPMEVEFRNMVSQPSTGRPNNRFLLSECKIAGEDADEASMNAYIREFTGKHSAGGGATFQIFGITNQGTLADGSNTLSGVLPPDATVLNVYLNGVAIFNSDGDWSQDGQDLVVVNGVDGDKVDFNGFNTVQS